MKKTKLFGFVLASMAALLIAGCQKPEEKVPGYDTATFEAAVASVSDYAATVNVSVKGNDSSPWYGFLSDDVTSAPEDVVSSFVSGLSVNKHILKTGNATIPLEDLERGKPYRYIVTGLTAAGFTYGTPAVAEFTTTGDYVYTTLTKDPDITIELGYNADSTKSVISIKGTSGYYDFDYMPESEFTKLYESTEEYAFARIDSLKAWGVDLASRIKSGDADYVVDLLPENTNVVAVVYSVTQNYNAAGTYADAVLFRKTISLVPTTYADWTGYWVLERAGEVDTLLIQQDKEGESYKISGFQGMPFAFPGAFDAESGLMEFMAAPDVYRYNSEGGEVEVRMTGLVNPDGPDIDDAYIITGNYPTGIIGLYDDGLAHIEGGVVSVNLGGGAQEYPVLGCGFFGWENGSLAYQYGAPLEFPATMKRIADAPPVYSEDLMRFCGTYDVPKDGKTFCTVTFSVDEEAEEEALLMTGWDKYDYSAPVSFMPDMQLGLVQGGVTIADSVVFNKTKLGKAMILARVRYNGKLNVVAPKGGASYPVGIVSYLGEDQLEINGAKIALDTDGNDIPEYYDVETMNLYFVDYEDGSFAIAQKSSPTLPLVLTPSAGTASAQTYSLAGNDYILEKVDPADILYAYPVQADINSPAFQAQQATRRRAW